MGASDGDEESLAKLKMWARTGNALAAYRLATVIDRAPSLGSDGQVIQLLEQAVFGHVLGADGRLLVTLDSMPDQKAKREFWEACLSSKKTTNSDVLICRKALAETP